MLRAAPHEDDTSGATLEAVTTGIPLHGLRVGGRTPLHAAAASGTCRDVAWLLTNAPIITAADLLARDARGRTALALAAWAGCAECVEAIVAAAGRCRAQAELLNAADDSGLRALHYAAEHPSVMTALMRCGASTAGVAAPSGDTALLTAVKLGSVAAVTALLASLPQSAPPGTVPAVGAATGCACCCCCLCPPASCCVSGGHAGAAAGLTTLLQHLEHRDDAGLAAEHWTDEAVWLALQQGEREAAATAGAADTGEAPTTNPHAATATLPEAHAAPNDTAALTVMASADSAVAAAGSGSGESTGRRHNVHAAPAAHRAHLAAGGAILLAGPAVATALTVGRLPAVRFQPTPHASIRSLVAAARRSTLAADPAVLPAALAAAVAAARDSAGQTAGLGIPAESASPATALHPGVHPPAAASL